MSTPISQYESSMYDALLSMSQGQWHLALKSLDDVEKACRRFDFLQALPVVFLNQMIAYEALNREPQLRRTWDCFLEQIEEVTLSNSFVEGAREDLKKFAQMMGTTPRLEALTSTETHESGCTNTQVSRSTAALFCTDEFAHLHPAVVGLTLGLVSTFSETNSAECEWLAPFVMGFGQQEEPDVYLELIALMDSEPVDTVRVYRSLCKLLEAPSESSVVIVCLAWLASLKLEGDGLPHKLAFSPNPPQEQRLLFTIRLLGSLGTSLHDRPGYEGVVECVWHALVDASEELNERIQLRHDKGGKKSVDVEVRAEIAFWHAHAECYFGAFDAAFNRLRPVAEIAGRHALNAQHTALRILRLRANVLEQAQQGAQALEAYARAISIVVPKFDPSAYLSNMFQGIGTMDGDSTTALELMRAFSGWLRLCELEASHRREIGYDLIELLDDAMSSTDHAEGSAQICLALAYQGDVKGARSAFVWSMRSGVPSLMVTSWVYRVLLDRHVFEDEHRETFEQALDLLECMPITSFRLTVQLLIAEGVLRSGTRALRPTAEMLIRRAALTLSSEGYRAHGDFAHLCLPSDWHTSLNDTIDAAVRVELSASLRPLLNVYADSEPTRRPSAPKREQLGHELSSLVGQIMVRFTETGGIDQDLVEQLLPMVPDLTSASTNRLPRLERPRGREAFLESYSIQGRWVVLLVSANGGGVLLPSERRPDMPAKLALAELLDPYLTEGERLYVSEQLPTSAVGFEQHLHNRTSLEIIYGTRTKRAKLSWSTPPSIMMIGDGWTTQHLNFLHSGLKDEANIRMCHEPEEQDGLTRGDWDGVDVVMLGVSLNSIGVPTLWENGQSMTVEAIGFARGENRQGLAVIVCSDREACHGIAQRLTDYFAAGVILASDTQAGYQAICEVVNRTGLLTDSVEVARYIKRGLTGSALAINDFCVLYTDSNQ